MGDAGGIPERQRRDARELLESVVEAVADGRQVPFESVAFGPTGGELGFNVRRGSLLAEYQTRTNVLEETPDLHAGGGSLVDIAEHLPLGEAGEEYARVEACVIDLVVEAVESIPAPAALDAVTVWPVTGDAGLYLVGFDATQKKFIYAGAFKVPPSALA